MRTIKVTASSSYNIYLGENILAERLNALNLQTKYSKIAVISDTNVASSIPDVWRLISGDGVMLYTVNPGEESKSINAYSSLLSFLAYNNFSRKDLLIAFGGGVVGDLTGFTAATYLRGIDFIQIPTTLLSMVDSSVGGKTGINLPEGKNLAGAFKQPKEVIIDTSTLKTLPNEEILSGFGEVIKYAILDGGELLDIIKNLQPVKTVKNGGETLLNIIDLCVNSKRRIVENDEFEKNERRLLNLGHSFAHAIEKVSNYTFSHGEAVGVGIKLTAELSQKLNLINEETKNQIFALLKDYTMPKGTNFDMQNLITQTFNDKKTESNYINEILIEGIGKCVIKKLAFDQLRELFK